ncbi:MAG: YhjD/YihY/BrkB family envelope integrity protein, partial [Gammaproteobacteria bacterium]
MTSRHRRLLALEGRRLRQLAAHPGAFIWRTLKDFRANQGLLLAGAVAYYALLSLVPLLILTVIALSHVIDPARLMVALRHYLEFVAPGQSGSLIDELRTFIEHRTRLGPVLLVTMIFFSALAFTVLENAMSVIFFHRVKIKR